MMIREAKINRTQFSQILKLTQKPEESENINVERMIVEKFLLTKVNVLCSYFIRVLSKTLDDSRGKNVHL